MATPDAPKLIAEAIEQDIQQSTNEVVSEVAPEVLPDLMSLAIGSPLPASCLSIPGSRIGIGEGQSLGPAAERERLQQIYEARATIGQERTEERMRAHAEVDARLNTKYDERFGDLDGQIDVSGARLA